MAALWLPFLFSPPSSFLAFVEMGTVAHPEWNINPSVWWGKLWQPGCWVLEPPLEEQQQVVLDTGPAMLTCVAFELLCVPEAQVFVSLLACLILRTDLSPSTSSRGLVASAPLTLLSPSFCFMDCLAYTRVLSHWPQQAQIPSSSFLSCSYSCVSRIHLLSIVPSAVLAEWGEMFLFPQWKGLKLAGLFDSKQWREESTQFQLKNWR